MKKPCFEATFSFLFSNTCIAKEAIIGQLPIPSLVCPIKAIMDQSPSHHIYLLTLKSMIHYLKSLIMLLLTDKHF